MRRGRKVIFRTALLLLVIGAITMMGACDNKVSSEKTASRAEQIAYLKEHEQEMTDYVKSQNSKIESVQFDWDSVKTGVTGNGTPQGAGKYLQIFGRFNEIENSGFRLDFLVYGTGEINLNSMILGQLPDIEGRIYYE